VIERWDVGPPSTKRVKSPSGKTEYIVIPGAILGKTTLFSDALASEGPVNYFLVNHGEPGTLFLQFIYSHAVYKLDVATGSMTLALSGAAFPPDLFGFTGMLEIDNPTRGFVYVLLEDKVPSPGNPTRVCVMADSARNGVLDGVMEVTFEQLDTLGYNEGGALNRFREWPPWF
jgi:hypothetical protein